MLKGKKLFQTISEVDYDSLQNTINRYTVAKQKAKDAEIIKAYKPSKKTIEGLKEENSKVENLIAYFSPFKVFTEKERQFYALLNKFFSFKEEQIDRMTVDTKGEIIESAVVGIAKSFRTHRQKLLFPNTMYEEDFKVNKLAYLMKNGQEPKVLPEPDFDFLEEQFIKAVRSAMSIYFKLNKSEAYTSLMYKSDDIMWEFRKDCLKGMGDIHSYYIEEIQKKFYFGTMDFEKDLEDIRDYKVNLLTYNFLTKSQNKCDVNQSKYTYIMTLCKYLSRFMPIMDKSDFEILANSLLLLIDKINSADEEALLGLKGVNIAKLAPETLQIIVQELKRICEVAENV